MDLDDEELKATRKMNVAESEKECLHCGKGKPTYCEKCYQEIIARNISLQYTLDQTTETAEEKLIGLIAGLDKGNGSDKTTVGFIGKEELKEVYVNGKRYIEAEYITNKFKERKVRLKKGKRSYTNKIRLNELEIISRGLVDINKYNIGKE